MVKQNKMWIDVRNELPELDYKVLCITRKFGFAQNRTETDGFAILWWDGKTWQDWEQDDYENNADYVRVVYWMLIPELCVG